MAENTDRLRWSRVDAPASISAAWPARALGQIYPLTRETVLIGSMLAAALVTRLWALDARGMSHDESPHVFYSWQLGTGKGFAHNPMMHGPFLFEATALMNVLFGASDFTSRLVPVILGMFIAIGVPQLLKPWLGRIGALAASALLLISPYVLYYSRYIRHDMLVMAWMLLALVAIFRYRTDRRQQDLRLLAIALALMFATMFLLMSISRCNQEPLQAGHTCALAALDCLAFGIVPVCLVAVKEVGVGAIRTVKMKALP